MPKLTPRQRRFVDEYLVDLNATRAAGRAGYSDPNIGRRLITKSHVARAIETKIERRSERVRITADDVLRKWWELVNADPRELVQYHRTACPECWSDAGDKKVDRNKINPGCGQCGGRGYGHVVVSDTRELSKAGQALYAGVKVGRDGLEVKMHDRMAALTNVAKHLNMFNDRAGDDEREDMQKQDVFISPDEDTPDNPVL